MLTSEHSIVEYKAGRAIPDRLTRNTHHSYPEYAERMLEIYRLGIGKTRRELHRQVEVIFSEEPNCPIRRIQSFCKLLDDKSEFQTDRQGNSARLRLEVFSTAADFHPLVKKPDRLFEREESAVKKQIAGKFGQSWEKIQEQLYADVTSFQRLEDFEGYPDGGDLLSRYNVSQLQACLYKAESVTVRARSDFTTILRYAKLARLLHEIIRTGPSEYIINLTGPVSVVSETRRYGVNFARFLPALLACKEWELIAVVQTPWGGKAKLRLCEVDGFTSHLPGPNEFDSRVEENFSHKFGTDRQGWRLIREGRILHEKQKVFVPDFVFRHEDGTEVLLEIVGFWTPQYLAYKRGVLQQFHRYHILLALPERNLREGSSVGDNIIVYKTALKPSMVLEVLERIRQGGRYQY